MEDHTYQLVLQFPGEGEEESEFILGIEESLAGVLEDSHHELDGHDFDDGTMNIFIDTNDPAEAFALVKTVIKISDHPMLKVAFRSFEEKEFHLIWPENSNDKFELM